MRLLRAPLSRRALHRGHDAPRRLPGARRARHSPRRPENRNLRLGTGRHRQSRSRQSGGCGDRDGGIREPASRRARASRGPGRHHHFRLALRHTQPLARRAPDFLSLLLGDRRHHDAALLLDRELERSQGKDARGRRRTARQELAHRPGRSLARGPRPQIGGLDRLRRTVSPRRQGAARRVCREPELLEFLCRARGRAVSIASSASRNWP